MEGRGCTVLRELSIWIRVETRDGDYVRALKARGLFLMDSLTVSNYKGS
jgi:hypothetical protein